MNKYLKVKIVEVFGSQADFAQELGVDESLVSRIVRGRRQLPISKQVEWAKALGCSTQDIFGRKV